ncbi:MAG: hypothetical protein JEZ11_02250 [Desulfobacterales bacterium]|nr:hypothetical protein [Desulfobacterales bacterium]
MPHKQRRSCEDIDEPGRTIFLLGEFTPGDNIKEDLLAIQRLYAEAGYNVPLDVEALDREASGA